MKIALRFAHVIPLDPARPFGTRRLIHAVRDGQSLVIFPEGRITVTGSLMKVYDGAALIAARADATIIPIRISGLEASPFSRLEKGQGAAPLVPEGARDRPGAGASGDRPQLARPEAA